MTDIMTALETAVSAPPGDLDVQISTAKAYPRDVALCVQQIGDLATMDEETAASCLYFVPRAGGYIEGYSVRFAEICMATWGNMRVATRNLPRQGNMVEAEAVAWDLEKNCARSKTCKRVAQNFPGAAELAEAAAQSIAARDAVYAVIPQGLLRSARQRMREMVLGTAEDMATLRAKVLEAFAGLGVSEAHLAKWIGPDSRGRPKERKDWTADDVLALRSLGANIRNGERTTMTEFGVADRRRTTAASGPQATASTQAAAERIRQAARPEQVEVEDAPVDDATVDDATVEDAPKFTTAPPMTTPAELLQFIRRSEPDLDPEAYSRVCAAAGMQDFSRVANMGPRALGDLADAIRKEMA